MENMKLDTVASYTAHETYSVETTNHEDHSFSGIMFDLCAKSALPVDYIEVQSLFVRGALGPMTIWYTPDSYKTKFDNQSEWEKVFDCQVKGTFRCLVELKLEKPIVIKSGSSVGIYVHSKLPGDQGLVYDNERSSVSHEDLFISVKAGMAHISNAPFSNDYHWGWAWRPRREFVGKITQGIRYLLWCPVKETHMRFPRKFRQAVNTLLKVHSRDEAKLSWISKDILFYILNMCGYDWFGTLEDDEKTKIKTKDDRDLDAEGIGWYNGNYRLEIANHRMSRGEQAGATNNWWGAYVVDDDSDDGDSDYADEGDGGGDTSD